MIDFDCSPQLKVVKRYIDSFTALDSKDVEPFLSKKVQYQAFPESAFLSDVGSGAFVEKWKGLFAAVSKLEVGIHRRKAAFKLTG